MLGNKENVCMPTEISLSKYKMWSIEGDRRGDVISCVNGVLWITQEGDLKDYVVEAGRNFWVTKPGTVVVQALDHSQFRYSLGEMKNHVKINPRHIQQVSHSIGSRLLR